jgi:integrase
MASTRERNGRFIGLYRDASGKQKSAGTFGTDKEALKAAEYAEAAANPPKPSADVEVYPSQRRGKVTVAGYAPKWLDEQLLEKTSRETYGRTADRIISHIGAMAREDVGPDDIRRMIKALKKAGLRDATIAATVDLARLMFGEEACAGVRFRIRDRREMQVVTRGQAKAIEDAMSPRYKLFVRALFATGCRWGEMIAVRGTDVERRGSGYVLKIRRTVIEVRGERSERPYGKSQKATRDITVPEALALDLMAFGPELCFTNARGGYLRRNAFRSGFWLPAIKKAGVPPLRVHDCRHSHASWLANDPRIAPALVRDRLGHSDLSVTSRYIHVMPGDGDPCLAVLGEAA